ncbi:hypothetical protein DYB32_004303 [Aphanomyces invadans]|uniref:Breast cancer type 2 susceptibility protein helical domain-containing protein n=1 Tax=Aphanomyces invadans TaxID=157072 RepID=A0A3R6VMM2_9STRA|nr:hypothetical protein DYB32_004303 [Aphanomyces invadans]
MFQTGSGRHVAVSVDQVEKYQRQQDLDEDGRSATDKVDATMAKALTDVVTTNSSFVEEAVKCRDVDGRSEKRDGNNEATSSDKNIALTCDGSAKGSSQAIKPTAVACVLESGRCQGVNVSQVPVSTLDGAVDSRKNVNDQNTAAHTPQVTPTTSAGPILCQIHQPAESSEALVSIDTASTKLDNSSTVPRSTAHGKRHPQSVVGTRRPKPFKPPQKLIKSPPCVVPAVESCLPPKAPVPVVAVPFSVSLSERWDFSSLAASPTAFNPYPFESVITNICATNAHLVHFNHVGRPEFVREQGDGMTLSAAELYQYMVSQRHILPALGASFAWFVNHFRWIVLKCAAMERTFVAHLFGKYCTQAQLAFQLSRRFHRELEVKNTLATLSA